MGAATDTLINPQNGMLAFRVTQLEDVLPKDSLRRFNYYTIVLVTEGQGWLESDAGPLAVEKDALLYFSLYQPFAFRQGNCKGYVLNFHPDFFCISKHDKEIACDGILFNNIYEAPLHHCDDTTAARLLAVIRDMRQELQEEGLAQHELLVSLLKIFLIVAARSKLATSGNGDGTNQLVAPPLLLQQLKDAIEVNYRRKHGASQYAELLHITPKALARMVKHHFNRTLTDMIADRIIAEAKRELYLTPKPVKAIAQELGFADGYHFSRFFKNKTAVSPALYRTEVKFTKAV